MSGGRGQNDRAGGLQSPRGDISDIRNRVEQVVQRGTVEEVDHARGMARIRVSETRVSGWVPWSTGNVDSGASNWNPLQVGAQVTLLGASGDGAQGMAIPGGYSNDNPSHSQSGDEYGTRFGDGTVVGFNKATKAYSISVPSGTVAVTCGAASVNMTDSAVTIAVGGTTLTVSASGVAITGGQVTHNGTDIGDTHTHASPETGAPTSSPI